MPQRNLARFVRYSYGGRIAYGRLEGDTVCELDGLPFSSPRQTGTRRPLAELRLLAPCVPSKVLAVGRNYLSHLSGRPLPSSPALFAKLPSSIIGPEEAIAIPPDARTVHYEGELVVVIGKMAKNLSLAEVADHIFGVTAGNDVSERNWQRDNLGWLRAKACDTFAPLGPAIVQGIQYNDLQLQTRLNGEVRQSQRTRDMLFDVETIVSYASRYFTLLPGDVIYTGTPGSTAVIRPGDIVEVELEGVGVLRNPVIAAASVAE